jgi:hypothetical protein
MDSAIIAYEENGYRFTETSEKWDQLCSVLPCFPLVRWPGYPTKVVEDEINGKPIVIQLWKGWFQQIGSNLPGGIGAEVGIYERVKGRGFPTERPDFLPLAMWTFLHNASKLAGGNFWWPVAEKNEVEFDFINPITDTVVFHCGPQKTYWCNKWMDIDSYLDYKVAQGKRWSWLPAEFPKNSRVPAVSEHLVMEYKINGKTYPRW